jgi:hypothetical protein
MPELVTNYIAGIFEHIANTGREAGVVVRLRGALADTENIVG